MKSTLNTLTALALSLFGFSVPADPVRFRGIDDSGKKCSIEVAGNGSTLLARISYTTGQADLAFAERGSEYLEEFGFPKGTPVFFGMIGPYDEYQGKALHLIPVIENGVMTGFSAFTFKDNTGFIRAIKPLKRVCRNLK